MTITYTTAEQTSINGTDVVVYTCPADTVAIISAAIMGNTGGVSESIGNLKINGVEYISTKSIATDGQILPEIEGQFLSATETVTVSATASTLNIRLSIKERNV